MDSILAVWAGAVALQPSILCSLAQTQTQSLSTQPTSSGNPVDGLGDDGRDDSSWAGLQALLALLLLPRASPLTDGSSALLTSGATVVTLPEQIAEWTSRAFRAILTLSSRVDDSGVGGDNVRAGRGGATSTSSVMMTSVNATGATRHTNPPTLTSYVSMQQQQQQQQSQVPAGVSHPRSYCNEEKDDSYDDAYDEESEDRSQEGGGCGYDRNMGISAGLGTGMGVGMGVVDMAKPPRGVFTTLQWRLFRSLWSLRPPLLLNEPMPMPMPRVNPRSFSSSSGTSSNGNSSGSGGSGTTVSMSYAISDDDEGNVGKHVFALLLAVVEGPPPRTTPTISGARATLGGQGLGPGVALPSAGASGGEEALVNGVNGEKMKSNDVVVTNRTASRRQGLHLEWAYRRKLCDELFHELRRASASAHTLAASVRPAAVAGTLSLLRCLLLPVDHPSSSSSSSSSYDINAVMAMMTGESDGMASGGGSNGNHCHSPSLSPDPYLVASHELLRHFVMDKGLLSHLMVDCLGFVPQEAFLASLAATQHHPPSYPHPPHTQHNPPQLDKESYTPLPFAGLHPLCSDERSKKAAFALLLSLCHWQPALIDKVFQMLQPVVASLPALTAWDYKPSRETRSSTGFVGLKNKGCTCYMNALLQVTPLSLPTHIYPLYLPPSLPQPYPNHNPIPYHP